MLKDVHHQLLQYYMATLIPILRALLAMLLLWDVQIAVTTRFFFSYHFYSPKRNCPEECRQAPLLLIPAKLPKEVVPGHRAFNAYTTPGETTLYNVSLAIPLTIVKAIIPPWAFLHLFPIIQLISQSLVSQLRIYMG